VASIGYFFQNDEDSRSLEAVAVSLEKSRHNFIVSIQKQREGCNIAIIPFLDFFSKHFVGRVSCGDVFHPEYPPFFFCFFFIALFINTHIDVSQQLLFELN